MLKNNTNAVKGNPPRLKTIQLKSNGSFKNINSDKSNKGLAREKISLTTDKKNKIFIDSDSEIEIVTDIVNEIVSDVTRGGNYYMCNNDNNSIDSNPESDINGDVFISDMSVFSSFRHIVDKTLKFNDIKLPQINVVKYMGSFYVEDIVVIGGMEWERINLKPGSYDAYCIDDNLMILNKELKIHFNLFHKSLIKKWIWSHSGASIGTECGTFGFFDLSTVMKIKALTNNSANNCRTMPIIDVGNYDSNALITGSHILELKKSEQKKIGAFGVMTDTKVKGIPGAFECFVIDNDRAILIGGHTANVLLNKNN